MCNKVGITNCIQVEEKVVNKKKRKAFIEDVSAHI